MRLVQATLEGQKENFVFHGYYNDTSFTGVPTVYFTEDQLLNIGNIFKERFNKLLLKIAKRETTYFLDVYTSTEKLENENIVSLEPIIIENNIYYSFYNNLELRLVM